MAFFKIDAKLFAGSNHYNIQLNMIFIIIGTNIGFYIIKIFKARKIIKNRRPMESSIRTQTMV